MRLTSYTVHQFSNELHYHIALQFTIAGASPVVGAAKFYSDGRVMYKIWPGEDVSNDLESILGDLAPEREQRRPSSEELDVLVGLAIMLAARAGQPFRPVTDQVRDSHRVLTALLSG